jgi:hypothetical protein
VKQAEKKPDKPEKLFAEYGQLCHCHTDALIAMNQLQENAKKFWEAAIEKLGEFKISQEYWSKKDGKKN